MGAATEIDLKMYHTALRESMALAFQIVYKLWGLQTLNSGNHHQVEHSVTLMPGCFLSPFWQPIADLAALCSH